MREKKSSEDESVGRKDCANVMRVYFLRRTSIDIINLNPHHRPKRNCFFFFSFLNRETAISLKIEKDIMKISLLTFASFLWSTHAFTPNRVSSSARMRDTSLHAIGALAKKAKEATLRQYIADGIEDSVMDKYNIIKEALAKDDESSGSIAVGTLQQTLTKRKGTSVDFKC